LPPPLYTVGHSNRNLADFLSLLQANEIEAIADVRRFPGSRRYPHFNQGALAAALADANIAYHHLPDLGGRRTKNDSPPLQSGVRGGSAWRVPAFAAFADYMLTEEFTRAAGQLADLAAKSRTAIMCAEALPWRCHRRLIADYFLTNGWQVLDIISATQTKPHELPPFAKITNGQLTYPGGDLPLFHDENAAIHRG
jgi:uncharacterized protein (DUF488 family)